MDSLLICVSFGAILTSFLVGAEVRGWCSAFQSWDDPQCRGIRISGLSDLLDDHYQYGLEQWLNLSKGGTTHPDKVFHEYVITGKHNGFMFSWSGDHGNGSSYGCSATPPSCKVLSECSPGCYDQDTYRCRYDCSEEDQNLAKGHWSILNNTETGIELLAICQTGCPEPPAFRSTVGWPENGVTGMDWRVFHENSEGTTSGKAVSGVDGTWCDRVTQECDACSSCPNIMGACKLLTSYQKACCVQNDPGGYAPKSCSCKEEPNVCFDPNRDVSFTTPLSRPFDMIVLAIALSCTVVCVM